MKGHTSQAYLRNKFFQCGQREGETIDQYEIDLKLLAKDCEFGNLTELLIRDRIVFGITNEGLKEKLLCTSDIDLAKALADLSIL